MNIYELTLNTFRKYVLCSPYSPSFKGIVINITAEQKGFIPCCAKEVLDYLEAKDWNIEGEDPYSFILRISPMQSPLKYKTTSALIKNLWYSRDMLFILKDKNENILVGARGIVLDKDFKPLIMAGYSFEGRTEGHPTLMVSPEVLSSDIPTLKFISKNLIPKIAECAYKSYKQEGFETPRIIIRDMEDWIITCSAPKQLNSSDINTFLKEELDAGKRILP